MDRLKEDFLVSICCVTYNHAEFIERCFEGFLAQKTSFNVEILIHDDASTDETQAIIQKLVIGHEDKFKLILQKENQWTNKGINPLINYLIPNAKGRYIALCEGDDYWIDPLKLQKQVDVLEQNSNLIASHCWQKYAHFVNGEWVEKEAPKSGHGYSNREIGKVKDIFSNQLRIKTRCVVYRNRFNEFEFPDWFESVPFGDVIISFLMGKYGKFHFIDEPMAVYRITNQGVSTKGKESLGYNKFRVMHNMDWIKTWDLADRHYNYEYHKEATETVKHFYKQIFKHMHFSWKDIKDVIHFQRNTRPENSTRSRELDFWVYGQICKKILSRFS